MEHVRILAQRHPHTKFVSIVGDKCIPNLPDARLPMLIIYRKGEVLNQIIAWGADRERRIEGASLGCSVARIRIRSHRSIHRTRSGPHTGRSDHPAAAE